MARVFEGSTVVQSVNLYILKLYERNGLCSLVLIETKCLEDVLRSVFVSFGMCLSFFPGLHIINTHQLSFAQTPVT